MLPWFAAFDHVNFTGWGIVQRCTRGFQHGDFVTKETENKFNQIVADNLALEHVNKSGKVTRGLVGITRTESAKDRWCLTYNERAKFSEDTKEMFGIGTAKDGVGHKDLGKARVQRDEDDVQRLMSHFRRYDVFRKTENLVVVTMQLEMLQVKRLIKIWWERKRSERPS